MRAHATQSGDKNWLVDEPVSCLEKMNYPCAVRALSSGSLNWEGNLLRLSVGTSVLLYGDRQFRLIAGTLGVNAEQPMTVHEATVQVEAQGDVWFEKPQKKQIFVKNLNGQIRIKVKQKAGVSSGPDQELPPGFENWYAGMNSEGRVEQGTLRPLDPKKVLKSWNRLYRYPRQEAETKVELYKELWRSAPEAVSKLYAESAQRMVASLEAEKEREHQQQEARKLEKAKLLKMFKSRYENGGLP